MTANRIKLLRQSAQMKQADLARRCGVKQGAVSTWENGTANPKPDALRVMADLFGVPVGYIMGYDDTAPELSDVEIALSGEIKSLNDREKQDVYWMLISVRLDALNRGAGVNRCCTKSQDGERDTG